METIVAHIFKNHPLNLTPLGRISEGPLIGLKFDQVLQDFADMDWDWPSTASIIFNRSEEEFDMYPDRLAWTDIRGYGLLYQIQPDLKLPALDLIQWPT